MSSKSKSLLLLPSPPRPINYASLSAAYSPALRSVARLCDVSILTIIVPMDFTVEQLTSSRSQIYAECQTALAGIYGLICQLALVTETANAHGLARFDPHIILVNHDKNPSSKGSSIKFTGGPLIDISTFALTRREWKTIYSVDGEQGQSLLKEYRDLANETSPPIDADWQVVEGGLIIITRTPPSPSSSTISAVIHHVVALGGTFDQLHAGHKLLLTSAALLLQPNNTGESKPNRLIIGITGDGLLKNKKYAEYIRSWQQRQEDVVDFLLSVVQFARVNPPDDIESTFYNESGPNGHAIHTKLKAANIVLECVEISDPYGPTITDESVTALVVSGETRAGGKAVNEKRSEKGWKTLEVYEVDVLDAEQDAIAGKDEVENFASKISSTAIRKHLAEKSSIIVTGTEGASK